LKNRLLVTSAICGLAFFTASPAFAACNLAGSTYTCTGSDTTGIVDGDNITVQVQAGADITPAAPAAGIQLNNDASISVEGAVNGNSGDGIFVYADATVIISAGGNVIGATEGIETDADGLVVINPGGQVSGALGVAMNSGGGRLGVYGTLSNGAALSGGSTEFYLGRGGTVGGIVDASGAGDTFFYDSYAGNSSFATGLIGTTYTGFESFVHTGSGTTSLTGTNALNWSIENTGALSVTDTASIANVDIGAGTTLDFDDVDGTYSDDVSGTGTWDIRNGSVLTLSGDNSGFTGTLNITTNNNVSVGTTANLGAGDITINQSTLTFTSNMAPINNITIGAQDASFDTGANTVGMTGLIDGTGGAQIIKEGSGTLALDAANTFDGGVLINAGTLLLTNVDGAGTGTITNNSQLTIGSTGGTLDNIIAGTGNVTKSGATDVTLAGANTYSGTTTISGGSILTVSAANNLGNSAATNDLILNNGFLTYTAAFDMTRDVSITGSFGVFNTNTFNAGITGDVTGAGGLQKNSTGILTITGNHSYAGDTIINGGTLNLVDSSTRTYNGIISGTGNLTLSGTGNLTLGGTNTYSGNTTISGGQTVTVNSTDDLGNEATTNDLVFNNGTLAYTAAFDQTRDVTLNGGATFATSTFDVGITGDVSGTGGITKTGSGTLALTGDHSYSGNTVISGGAVEIIDATDRSYAGNISGAGNYLWSGTGEITLTGNNTSFSGDYIIGNGAIIIGSANALGSSDIVLDGGIIGSNISAGFTNDLVVNAIGGEIDTSGATWGLAGASTITGTGDLFIGGGNTFSFGATNTMSGALSIGGGTTVTVTDGTDSLGDASVTNTITLDDGILNLTSTAAIAQDIILAAGDGIINTNANNVTYSGDITGAAGSDLAKTGAGTLTMSGTSTYGGILNINAGAVNVSGTAGDVTINNTGFLRGTGTVGDTIVNSGGTFSPGNSIGVTNVTGDLTFNAGSHYAVEYTATPDDSDKIIATGNIVIDNGAILDLTGTNGNYLANTNYTILSGASVTGLFGTVNNNLVFLDVDFDDTTATDLIMTLTRNNTSFADILNEDEQDFADAFDDLANDLTTAFTNLTAAQAQAAADTLSNEHQGGVSNFASTINAGVLMNISNRMAYAFNGSIDEIAAAKPAQDGTYVAAYMTPGDGGTIDQSMNFWMQAIGSMGRSDSTAADPATDRHSYGALAGVDIPFDDKGVYGFFAGYETGEVETNAQLASSDLDNYHLGAYATRPLSNGLMINGGAAFTYHNIDTLRYVVIPGFEAAPESETGGYSASGFVEVSKPMQANGFKFAPYASAGIAHTSIDGYAEENGGLANLVIDDYSTTNPFTVIGMRFAAEQYIGSSKFDVFAGLGWQHAFGSLDSETRMRFETGTATFESGTAPRARDAAILNFGLSTQLMPGMNAYAGYNGNWSGYAKDHGFEAGLQWKF